MKMCKASPGISRRSSMCDGSVCKIVCETLPPNSQHDTDSKDEEEKQESLGLIADIWQTQLSIWTFFICLSLTYLWRRRFKIEAILLASAGFVLMSMLSTVAAAFVFGTHLLQLNVSSVQIHRAYVKKFKASSLSDLSEPAPAPTRLLRKASIAREQFAIVHSPPPLD